MKRIAFLCIGVFILAPGCAMKKSSDQSVQLDARQMYDNVRYEYERELVLFRELGQASDAARPKIVKKINDEILLKNEQYNDDHRQQWFAKRWLLSNNHENYPYIQYKEHLDSYVYRLEHSREKLYWKTEGVGYLIEQLVKELEKMRRYVITSNQYQRELRMIEQHKIQVKKEQHEKAQATKVQKKKR